MSAEPTETAPSAEGPSVVRADLAGMEHVALGGAPVVFAQPGPAEMNILLLVVDDTGAAEVQEGAGELGPVIAFSELVTTPDDVQISGLEQLNAPENDVVIGTDGGAVEVVTAAEPVLLIADDLQAAVDFTVIL